MTHHTAWDQLFKKFEGRVYAPNRAEEEKRRDLEEFLTEDFFLTNNELRDKQYSQRKHARIRGFDSGTFNQWINGQRLPDGDNLFHLALVYGPIIYDIIGVKGGGYDPRERFVVELFRGFDDDGRRDALKLLKDIKERREPIDSQNPEFST